MKKMLDIVIKLTFEKVNEWKKILEKDKNFSIELVEEIYKHIMHCVNSCVFGINNSSKTYPYSENGT